MRCLYVNSRNLDPPDRQIFLGHIYEVTRCHPLIIALFQLIKQDALPASYHHILCEGFYVLFWRVIPVNIYKDHDVFDYSDKCLLFMSKYTTK